MQWSILTFRSVTPAQRALLFLRREGISGQIQRTPRYLENQGCGYGVRVPYGNVFDAAQRLRSAGINYRKVYLLLDEGKVEELHI